MKVAIFFLSLTLSNLSFSETLSLSYKDNFKINQVIVLDAILIDDLLKIYGNLDFDGQRMIAGKFESTLSKSNKKSYIDNLRLKLEKSKGTMRF